MNLNLRQMGRAGIGLALLSVLFIFILQEGTAICNISHPFFLNFLPQTLPRE